MTERSLFDVLDEIEDRGASRISLRGEGPSAPPPLGVPRGSAPRSLDQARAERDAAMQQVQEHAPEEWKTRAWRWLLDYLRTHAEFFPDDAWAAGCPVPPERRAFGPIVQRAAREGLITKSGRLRQRTRGHATPAEVWNSTQYQEASA